MAAESAGGQSSWREVVDTLLPAAVLVLGLQAWRAGLTFLPGGGVAGLLAAVLFLAVPVARLTGHLLGARRAAGLMALALAGTRLGIQIGGPNAAPAYGIAGTALMAAYLELWATSPGGGRRLWAWLLGLHLHLADRLLTDTVDLIWLPGPLPLTISILLTLPVLFLAMAAMAGPNQPPRQTPAALAVPLLVALLAMLLHHPARVAALTGWSVPSVLLLMALGAFLAALLVPIYDGLHAGLLHRKSRARLARGLLTTLTALFTGLLAGGLVWPRLLPAAVLAGPFFLSLPMLALWRARPVGRSRLVGEWASLPAWWLALAAQVEGFRALWPVAVVGGVLVALGLVAAWHQERPANTPAETPLWPRLLCLIPLLLAAWTALRFQTRTDDLRAVVPLDVFRILAVDAQLSHPRELPDRLAELREIGAQVIVLSSRPDTAGYDAGYWLARRLGLVARPFGRQGQVLARARPAYVVSERGIPVSIWRYGNSALALARVEEPDAANRLARAYEAVAAFPRRLVTARVASLPPGWRPPGDSRVAETVASRGSGQLLLLGRGVNTLAPPKPPVLPRPGLSALLAIEP